MFRKNGKTLNVLHAAVTFFVAVTFLGCRGDRESSSESKSATELLLADQIAEGRLGQRDRLELSKSPAGDSMLQDLSVSDDWVKALILDAGTITDEGVESIAKLTNLSHLRLRHSPIGDAGLSLIAGCQSLQILNLPQCGASAEGVALLARLPNLRNLRLGGPQLSAAAARSVAAIKSLRNIHLIGIPVDDEGLRQIASLPKLQSLYLDDSSVTQDGWDWLFETHPDLHVHVNQRHLDRDHSEHDDALSPAAEAGEDHK